MKRNVYIVIIGALLIIIGALVLFVFQVRQSEVAVVTTFSKPTRMVGPGPHFKWPPPIQKVYKFDQRIQNFDDKLTEALTSDQFTLNAWVYIGWRITNPTNFFQRFRDGQVSEAEARLENLLRAEKLAVIARHPLSDFVSASGPKLEQIEKEILEGLQKNVEKQDYGLSVEFLGLKKIGFPDSVTQAVFDKMKAERSVRISKLTGEGTSEALKIKADAELAAARTIADADAQAQRIRGQGEAAAAEAAVVFQKNPALASYLFRLAALESALTNRATLIFDQNTPPFDLLKGISTNLVK